MKNLLQPYDPEWADIFVALKVIYLEAMPGVDIDIQHVGSTSIPGAVAKPILDIDIILSNINTLPEVTRQLGQLGYRSEGEKGIPGRYAFRQRNAYTPNAIPKQAWMEHHLYVCYPDSLALKNHLLFRDLMRASPGLVQQYSTLKLDLAARPGITRETYTQLKTSFIIKVLADAGLGTSDLSGIAAANT